MNHGTDDNNNTSAKKSYSLRPRTTSKRDKEDVDEEDTWRPRDRSRRRQKQKSAPLSKYRRKTANARERSRMREINDAFESLRRAIPHLASNCDNSEKISKIMTLRLAMKYITALSNALEDPESYSFDFQTTVSLMDSSSTTSSVSDHGSWREQLFVSTPPLESTSTIPSSCPCSVRSYESVTKVYKESDSKVLSLLTPDHTSQETSSHFHTRATKTTSCTGLLTGPPHHTLPELSRHTLTPPEEHTLLHPSDNFQSTIGSSVSEFQATTSLFTTDFDGLPSPVMDFCDLFVT